MTFAYYKLMKAIHPWDTEYSWTDRQQKISLAFTTEGNDTVFRSPIATYLKNTMHYVKHSRLLE